MRFWLREILGLILVFIGLALFYLSFAMLMRDPPYIFEAPMMCFIGAIVFRGGIHLLKVAVAARVAMTAPRDVPAPAPTSKAKGDSKVPWDW
jgi:hypothetical protein